MRLFSVGEVTLSKDDPLSVDLTMVPDRPTATKVLFAKVTPKRLFEVGEVALSQDDPLSVDLRMVPDRPTATNIPEPEELSDVVVVVVVELSSVVVEVVEEPPSLLLLQEMTVKLKRKRERIMSICFTWFPIGGFRITQYITSIGLFYKNVGILLGGCLTVKN